MFSSVDDIEYQYNLNFLPEIKNKYNDDIINIFNGDLSNYSIYETNDPEINIILAIYYSNTDNRQRAYNILININEYPRALCTLGVMYNQNNYTTDETLECFIKAYELGEKTAIYNLAYQYYLMNDINNFNKYNNMLDDESKFINLALFELNMNHNYDKGLEYIKKACVSNNYRAYYIYAYDFLKNNIGDEFYKNLFLGFKIKPKKQYIEFFIKNTTPELRYLLCYKYDYPIEEMCKYDNLLSQDIIKFQIIKDKVCPVCLIKTLNIKLKCNHSFCESCIINYKKCILCINK